MATSSKIKLVLQEYLTKNINKYHYIRIHKINNKSANNFILNYKGNIPLERYYIALVSNIHTTTQEIRNGNHMKNQSEFRVSNPNNKSYSKEKLCNKNFSNNTNVKINVTDKIKRVTDKNNENVKDMNQENKNIDSKKTCNYNIY